MWAESFDNDDTCCRWCSQSFRNLRGRQRHEKDEHNAEYKGTYSYFKQKGYYESKKQEFAQLAMCELCSVFVQTKKEKQDAHKRTSMHLSKQKEHRCSAAGDVNAMRKDKHAVHKSMKTTGHVASKEAAEVCAPAVSNGAVCKVKKHVNASKALSSPKALPFVSSFPEDENDPAFDFRPYSVGNSSSPQDEESSSPETEISAERTVSIDSTPPSRTENALGRIVVFSYWESGLKGKKCDAHALYNLDIQRERLLFSKSEKAIKKNRFKSMKKHEADAVLKKPLAFAELSPQVQAYYQALAKEHVDYGYYVIESLQEVKTCDYSSVDPCSSSSSSSVALTASQLFTKIDTSCNYTPMERKDLLFHLPAQEKVEFFLFESHHQSIENARKHQRLFPAQGKNAVLRVSWTQLQLNSYWLSPFDILETKCREPLPQMCSQPKCRKVPVKPNYITWCDGSPLCGRGPCAFPCQRAVICSVCRAGRTHRDSQSWLCPFCIETPLTFASIYGFATPPRDDSTLSKVFLKQSLRGNTTSITGTVEVRVRTIGAPILDENTNWNPAQRLQKMHEAMSEQPDLTPTEGLKAELSASLHSIFLNASLSEGQQQKILFGLRELQERELLQAHVKIPSKHETMLKWSKVKEKKNVSALHAEILPIDCAGLLQGQRNVNALRINGLDMTQAIVLKEDIPNFALYLGRGEDRFFADGTPCIGGEIWFAEFYKKRCRDFAALNNNIVLFIGLCTDKMKVVGKTSSPFYFCLFNVASAFRHLAIEICGFAPVIRRRKPHGSKLAEPFSPEQMQKNIGLMHDTMALFLKPFEEANRQGGAAIKFKDGVVRVCNFALLCIPEDMEQKVFDAVCSLKHCPKCWLHYRHYGSSESCHVCGSGQFGSREPLQILRFLRKAYLEQSIYGMKSATDKLAASVGYTHYRVVYQLLAFSTLIGEGGVASVLHYDDLHMLFLGLFVLILKGADVLFGKWFKRTSKIVTVSDKNQVVENILACIPGFNDGVHRLKAYILGWWAKDSWSAGDYRCYIQHLLFVFATNDVLITDLKIRSDFAYIVRQVNYLYICVTVKTTWRTDEIERLRSEIQHLLRAIQVLFECPVNDGPEKKRKESDYFDLKPVAHSHSHEESSADDQVEELGEGGGAEEEEDNEDEEDETDAEVDNEEGDDDDEDDDDENSNEEADEGVVETNVIQTERHPQKLSGNDIRTPKIHALPTIPETVIQLGSTGAATTSFFEEKHRGTKGHYGFTNKHHVSNTENRVLAAANTVRFGHGVRSKITPRIKAFLESRKKLPEEIAEIDLKKMGIPGFSQCEARKTHLLHLVNQSARVHKSSSKHPVDDALSYLNCFDFDALRVFRALKRIHGADIEFASRECTYSPKLQLPRIPATAVSGARPAVILIPGHHVIISSGELSLFLGSLRKEGGGIFAYILKLDPYTQKPVKKHPKKKSRHSSSRATQATHPIAKLKYFERRNVDAIELIPVSEIHMKVRVVPAFNVSNNMEITIDGYLLSHGVYNFDYRGKNEQPI